MIGEEDVQQLFQELSRGVVEGQLRNLRHYNELRELIALGAVDQGTVSQAYRAYANEVSADYKHRVADLSVRYYAELFELGNEFSRRFYDRVLDGVRDGHGPSPGPARPVPVELTGPLGGQAETRFELANDRGEAVDVSFLVSPLRGPEGELFRPIAIVEPAHARLQHGDVLAVRIRIVLEPAMFRPERIYTGGVEVIGFPDVALALSVWAAPEPAEPPRAEPPTAEPLTAEPRKAAARKAAPRKAATKAGNRPAKATAAKATAAKRPAKATAAKAANATPAKAARRRNVTP